MSISVTPTSSILKILIENSDQLRIARIERHTVTGINHGASNKIWYLRTDDPADRNNFTMKGLCIAETTVFGNGERLFSVREVTGYLTKEEEYDLIWYTLNGSVSAPDAAPLTALSVDEFVGVLTSFCRETAPGYHKDIHPRGPVADAVENVESCVASVTIGNSEIVVRGTDGLEITISKGTMSQTSPYNVSFEVTTFSDNKESSTRIVAADLVYTLSSQLFYV